MPITVSVIIATFNYGRFLKRAIESVLFQDYSLSHVEIIIVDGPSTDNTDEVLDAYRDRSNIHILKQTGQGLANAVNLGLANASGTYISRLDADDLFCQGILAAETRILNENSDLDFVYPDYYYNLEANGYKVRKFLPEFSVQELRERGDFLSGGAMFRRTLFEQYGGVDETVPTLDSYELILRFLQQGVVGYHIPEPLFEYTIHGSSLSDNVDLIERTGHEIAARYGVAYIKNENHPREIPGIVDSR